MFETKRAYWRRLDNAAKLFPATSNKKDTRVFRFYCELNERVEGSILQEALNITLEKYPVFLSVMRAGLFWHYLEKSKLRPVVREEYKEPCSNIYIRDKQKLLFEVTYYKNRINFEVYHALTDGTGATEFVRELVKNYIFLAHKGQLPNIEVGDEKLTIEDQENDSFTKYYSPNKKREKDKKPKAFQIRKPRKERGRLQITEGILPVDQVLQKTREAGVSITVYLTAALICAIHEEMTKLQEKRPVILMVPVNLRKFFPSASMLNFFGWIEPGYQFADNEVTFEQVLAHVKEVFERELQKDRVAERMDKLIAFEFNPFLKMVPLSLKNLCINAGAKMSAKDVTAIFSNMSIVKMPDEYVPYIKRFGVFTSTPKIELCMCSFQNTISLGFTSFFDSTNIKRNFFRILSERGITYEIAEPEYPKARDDSYKGLLFFRSFSFICLALAVICGMINYLVTPQYHWGLIASGGIASMWVLLAIGFRKRHNLLKNAIWQLLIITIGCILWDVGVGWMGWSVDYVLPAACVAIQISMLVISKIQKHSAREYMIYFVMATGYGVILPLILLLTKVITVTYPAVICIGISFLFLAALPIFKGKEFKEEMHKKFHI